MHGTILFYVLQYLWERERHKGRDRGLWIYCCSITNFNFKLSCCLIKEVHSVIRFHSTNKHQRCSCREFNTYNVTNEIDTPYLSCIEHFLCAVYGVRCFTNTSIIPLPILQGKYYYPHLQRKCIKKLYVLSNFYTAKLSNSFLEVNITIKLKPDKDSPKIID